MNIADLDFLTAGSLFTREDGRETRFLFLTNTSLPENLKKKFPPQVVYSDENDNVLSCDIDRFLNKRKFVSVDPDLEARLLNLLATSNSESSLDELDLDELTVDDDGLEVEEEGDDFEGLTTESADDDIDEQTPFVTFTPIVSEVENLPVIIDADTLSRAVNSYQQQPGNDSFAVQHVLFIRAETGIDVNTLHAVFSPSHENKNVTYEFEVAIGNEQSISVNWDTLIGIYPCVFYGSRMYQVVFSAPLLSAATQAAIDSFVDAGGVQLEAAVDALQEFVDAEIVQNVPVTQQALVVPTAPAVQVAPVVMPQVTIG